MPDLDRDILITAGKRYPGSALLAQKGYTVGVAATDKDALIKEGLLTAEAFTAVEKLEEELKLAMTERANVDFEKSDLTRIQNAKFDELKIRERRMDRCASNAFRGTGELDEYRRLADHGMGVTKTCDSVDKRVAFLERYPAKADAAGANTAFRQGISQIVAELRKADAAQSAALGNLPEKARKFCEVKGRLFYLIKEINTAGQALHAADPDAAAKYNLSTLYQLGHGGGKRKANPA